MMSDEDDFWIASDPASNADLSATALDEMEFRDGARPVVLTEPDPEGIRTYAVIDPTLHRKIVGLFDLDNVDIPARSLFSGAAADEATEVAPYLVDLTVLADRPVPYFNRDFVQRHWGKGTGLILRTSAPFDVVRAHLRKFTKLRREADGKWYFFRFWDPRIAGTYFRTIRKNRPRVDQWFGCGLIDGYIVDEDEGRRMTTFRRVPTGDESNTRPGPVVLTDWELEPFRRAAHEKDLARIAADLKRDFGQELKAYSPETLTSLIRPILQDAETHGFRRREHLHVIAAWGLFFGANFVTKDPEDVLNRIWTSEAPEAQRFAQMKTRIAALGQTEAA